MRGAFPRAAHQRGHYYPGRAPRRPPAHRRSGYILRLLRWRRPINSDLGRGTMRAATLVGPTATTAAPPTQRRTPAASRTSIYYNEQPRLQVHGGAEASRGHDNRSLTGPVRSRADMAGGQRPKIASRLRVGVAMAPLPAFHVSEHYARFRGGGRHEASS